MVPVVFENVPSQVYNALGGKLNAMGGPEMSENSDELRRLVERCNGGEDKAWQEFWSRYHNKVSRAVRRLYSSTPGEVEDIVQEVFFQLFRALRSYEPSRPVEPYILKIARNVAISYIRGPKPTNPLPDPPLCPDAEESLSGKQEEQLLRRSLDTLPENCRRLIDMKCVEGLSYSEISSR